MNERVDNLKVGIPISRGWGGLSHSDNSPMGCLLQGGEENAMGEKENWLTQVLKSLSSSGRFARMLRISASIL